MRNLKKLGLSLVLVMMIIASPLLLFACAEKPTLEISTSFKTTYYIGESLDVSNGVLKYTKDGKENFVDVEENMITGFSSETAGTRELTITYEDLTIQLSYTINDYISEISLESSFKTDYYKNDELDVSGGKIKLKKKDLQDNIISENSIEITTSMVSNFSTAEIANNKKMTISYNGLTLQIDYTVKAWELQVGMGYKSSGSFITSPNHWLNIRSQNPLTKSIEAKWYRSAQSTQPESRPGLEGNVDIILNLEAILDSNGNLDHYMITLEGVTVEAHMISKDVLRVYGEISYEYNSSSQKSEKKIDPSKHELWTLIGPS